MRGFTDDILDEPIDLESKEHEPPADQTAFSDGDLLDKLADHIAHVGRVEIVNVPSGLPARLALRKTLAQL
jgi:hypothetical protein